MKSKKKKIIKNRNGFTYTENKLVVTKEEREGGAT